jgi:hypothetical protein
VGEEIAMAYTALILVLLAATVAFTTIPTNSFAQQEGWIVKTSGAGSLDIMLEQIWTDDGTARFKISFLQPNTTTLHEHQDYDVLIRQGDNQIFSAAAEINQPLIHNAEGVITIPLQPFQFPQNGDYTVEVQVLGLGFPPIPINPETATFPITVVPEFPVGLIGVFAAVIASSVLMTRKLKLP